MVRRRIKKVSSLLLNEIGNIILTKLKDPRLSFVTVTDVHVSNDLKNAKIFISVFSDESVKDVSINVLQHAAPFIQSQLKKKIKLRYMPNLMFIKDTSLEKADKINRILNDINSGRKFNSG